MTKAIITVKLMMDSPETDLAKVREEAKKVIESLKGEFGKSEEIPVAFGLKALNVILVADEDIGTDAFETKLGEMEGVSSAEVIDYRRALG